jgi:hypothetical protein
MNTFNDFANSAKELAKNPLGIIALFILLIYGFACLFLGVSAKELQSVERLPIIWFMVIFPVIVLGVFGWLVSRHHNKLYAPTDYRDDESFLKTTINQPDKNSTLVNENIELLMEYGKDFEIIKKQENKINEDLKNRNINNDENKITILIRNLATEQVKVWFAEVYYYIFGSQIELLKLLVISKTYDFKFIENYFNNIKEKNIETFNTWDTKKYMDYLINLELVHRENDNFLITTRGEEFIRLLNTSRFANESKSL